MTVLDLLKDLPIAEVKPETLKLENGFWVACTCCCPIMDGAGLNLFIWAEMRDLCCLIPMDCFGVMVGLEPIMKLLEDMLIWEEPVAFKPIEALC